MYYQQPQQMINPYPQPNINVQYQMQPQVNPTQINYSNQQANVNQTVQPIQPSPYEHKHQSQNF